MCSNSSAPIADLTVGKREFNYMRKLMKEKRSNVAKLLSKKCRYVDDTITLNYLYFHKIIKQGLSQDFWQGSAIWSKATDSVTCFASEAARSAADRTTAVVRGAKLPSGAKLPVGKFFKGFYVNRRP